MLIMLVQSLLKPCQVPQANFTLLADFVYRLLTPTKMVPKVHHITTSGSTSNDTSVLNMTFSSWLKMKLTLTMFL